MIEELFLNYGPLGIMVFVLVIYNQKLIKKRDEVEKKLFEIIDKNTFILGEIKEFMEQNKKR